MNGRMVRTNTCTLKHPINVAGTRVEDPKLQGYLKHLSRDKLKVVIDYSMRDWIRKNFATKAIVDVCPRSIFMADKYSEKLSKCFDLPNEKYSSSVDQALNVMFDKFFFGTCQPYSYENVANRIPKDTSAGAYAFGSCKGDVLDSAIEKAKRIPRDGLNSVPPIVPGYRTQLDNKVRMVHMYPVDMCIFEMRYSYALAEHLVKHKFPFTYGMDVDKIGIELKNFEKGKAICLDFKAFDTTVPKQLLENIFIKLGKFFGNYTAERDFRLISEYFINGCVVDLDGTVRYRTGYNLPSGSAFTNIIGSLVNYVLTHAMADDLGFSIERSLYCGDDTILNLSIYPDVKLVSAIDRWYNGMGMKVSLEDTKIDSIHFVGYTWKNGSNHMSSGKNPWSMLVYPERWRNPNTKPWEVAFAFFYNIISLRGVAYDIKSRFLRTKKTINVEAFGIQRAYGRFHNIVVW